MYHSQRDKKVKMKEKTTVWMKIIVEGAYYSHSPRTLRSHIELQLGTTTHDSKWKTKKKVKVKNK